MKISEIINFEPTDTKKDYEKYLATVKGKTKHAELGTGAFGKALKIHSPKRGEYVSKIGISGNIINGMTRLTVPPEKDGYLSYLRAVDDFQKRTGIVNSYFPRIRDLKIKKFSDTEFYYKADIEHLTEFTDNKIYGNDELTAKIYRTMFLDDPEQWQNSEPVSSQIIGNINMNNYSMIKDDSLHTALRLINKIVEKNQALSLDLHEGNFMWRVSRDPKVLPHLVFVDPIS